MLLICIISLFTFVGTLFQILEHKFLVHLGTVYAYSSKATCTASPEQGWTVLHFVQQHFTGAGVSSVSTYIRFDCILLSVFKDENTPSPFVEEFLPSEGEGATAAKPDNIYLDAMGFGMGCCCLQVDFGVPF